MSEEQNKEVSGSRRKFLEKAGKVSLAAPAAALLLAARAKNANAGDYTDPCTPNNPSRCNDLGIDVP
jgi:hypothetical protein